MTTEKKTAVDALWTPEFTTLVRSQVCPKGIPDEEFALFVMQCKRSGLNPMLKEAYCVARKHNFGSKDRPNWGTKYEFQPSEAGMLARAERFADYRGIQAAAVYGEDEILVDMGTSTVKHAFNPAKRKGAIVGAWARVERRDHVAVLVWLDFAGYVQQSPMWSKIPSTMMEKCARVAALRKAYPESFGGIYIREEMPEGEFVEPEAAPLPTLAAVAPPAPEPKPEATPPLRAPQETSARTATEPSSGPASPELTDAELAEIRTATDKTIGALVKRVSAMPKGERRSKLGDAINARRRDLKQGGLAASEASR